MITINGDDLPVEVAAKLITSTVRIKRSRYDIAIALATGKTAEEEVDVRIFDKQELKAIAEHLLIYVRNEDEE